jgi:hypothetical protein
MSQDPAQNEESLEVVFETVDPTEVVIIKSLLEAASIPYVTRGEDQYDAFRGAFRGTVFNPRGRPVAFLVPAGMAEDARLLLQAGELPDEEL